jgi:predicted AAA+ superfamily ATPase
MPKRLYFDLFYPLVESIANQRAVVLMGPRRVGKTVLLRHTIQQLISQGVPAQKIIFLSIDAPIYNRLSLEKLFEISRKAIGDLDPAGYFVIYDEIQYLKDWEVHLKSLVDKYRQTKFVASGSAAAALRLKSTESGAGRFTDFTLPPLTFQEYLHLKGQNHIMSKKSILWMGRKVEIFGCEDLPLINQHFVDYINIGGYPEAVFNPLVASDPGRFIKNDIVDKVLLRDLPSLYGITDVQELNSLFTSVVYNTANEVTLENLNQSSHVQKPTIKRYLEYLEAAFLIKRVDRIDMSGKAFKRANYFKIYLTNPSLRRALFSPIKATDEKMGDLVETAIMAQWMHRNEPIYYARWQKEKAKGEDGEVDIVSLTPTLKPGFAVECKWSDYYAEQPNKLKSLQTFMDANNLGQAVVTTISVFKEIEIGGKKLQFIPSSWYAYTVGANSLLQRQLDFFA